MNEKLAANVLRNWERFVDGLQQVTQVQADIEVGSRHGGPCVLAQIGALQTAVLVLLGLENILPRVSAFCLATPRAPQGMCTAASVWTTPWPRRQARVKGLSRSRSLGFTQAAYLTVKDVRSGLAHQQAEAAAMLAVGAASGRRGALAAVAGLLARLSAANAARIAITCARRPGRPGGIASPMPPTAWYASTRVWHVNARSPDSRSAKQRCRSR